MKYLKELKDYKGYLTGSLVHLYKHKNELEKEINNIEIKIDAQLYMSSNLPSRNKSSMIREWRMELNNLKKELSEVNIEIEKLTKSKLDERMINESTGDEKLKQAEEILQGFVYLSQTKELKSFFENPYIVEYMKEVEKFLDSI